MSATSGDEAVTRRVDECERVLGYKFSDPETLIRALTHSSSRTAFSGSNERLEFLGDAILGAVVSLYLYAHHPEFQEGRMTKVKSQVVSRRSLAQSAQRNQMQPPRSERRSSTSRGWCSNANGGSGSAAWPSSSRPSAVGCGDSTSRT